MEPLTLDGGVPWAEWKAAARIERPILQEDKGVAIASTTLHIKALRVKAATRLRDLLAEFAWN
jgi:hypothetical protein